MTAVPRQLAVAVALSALGPALAPIRLGVLTHVLGIADYGALTILFGLHLGGSYFLGLCLYQWVFFASTTANDLSSATDAVPLHAAITVHLGIATIGAVLLGLFADTIARGLGIPGMTTETAVIGLATLFGPVFLASSQYIYSQRRVAEYNLMVFLRANIWIFPVFGVFLLPLERRLVATAVCFASTMVLVTAGALWRTHTGKTRFAFSGRTRRLLRNGLRYSLPLYPFALATELLPVVPRIALAHAVDVLETGRFVIAYTLGELLFNGSLTLVATVLPYVFRSLAKDGLQQGQRQFALTSEIGLLVLIASLGVVWAVGEPMIRILTPDHDPTLAAAVLALMTPGIILKYCALVHTQPILAHGRTRLLGVAYGGSATLAVGALIGAAISWGARGVAVAGIVMPLGVLAVLSFDRGYHWRLGKAVTVWAFAIGSMIPLLAVFSLPIWARTLFVLATFLFIPRAPLRATWPTVRQVAIALFRDGESQASTVKDSIDK